MSNNSHGDNHNSFTLDTSFFTPAEKEDVSLWSEIISMADRVEKQYIPVTNNCNKTSIVHNDIQTKENIIKKATIPKIIHNNTNTSKSSNNASSTSKVISKEDFGFTQALQDPTFYRDVLSFADKIEKQQQKKPNAQSTETKRPSYKPTHNSTNINPKQLLPLKAVTPKPKPVKQATFAKPSNVQVPTFAAHAKPRTPLLPVKIQRTYSSKQSDSKENNSTIEVVNQIDEHVTDSQIVDSQTNTSKVKTKETLQNSNNVHDVVSSASLSASSSLSSTSSSSNSLTPSKNMLEYWGVPTPVANAYRAKGISELYNWQVECLELPGVLSGKNLVYSAPTSSGKSLVAEILLLRSLIQRRKKALYILPFVSVVHEKLTYLNDVLQSMDFQIAGFYANKGGFTLEREDDEVNVAICTIEKANSLINRLMSKGSISDISLVVVDEIHMMSDRHRGYLLELLITKLLYLNKDMQVIGLSATLPNINIFKTWLKGEVYVSAYRPVPLKEHIKIGNKIYDKQMNFLRAVSSIPSDREHIALLCSEVIAQGNSVLVFCALKREAEQCCNAVASTLPKLCTLPDCGQPIKLKRIELVAKLSKTPGGLDSILEQSVLRGVAFHHAGLTIEERELVENAFRVGTINVLMATCTLAAGVNLPARRVIFRTPFVGLQLLDATKYQQMSGRAGRKGIDKEGESILIIENNQLNHVKSVIQQDIPPLCSCLSQEQRGMTRALLEVISSSVVETVSDVERYLMKTLLAAQRPKSKIVHIEGRQALKYLLEHDFIVWSKRRKFVSTNLGNAAIASSLSPEESLVILKELSEARKNFVLDDELHLVYHVTPIFHNVTPQKRIYKQLWHALSAAAKRIAALVGVTDASLNNYLKSKYNANTKIDEAELIVRRFFAALMLADLVHEVPISDVASKYGVPRGSLQALQSNSATFAGMVAAFCHHLQWRNLELLISQFSDRLNFGVELDILYLVQIPNLTARTARLLYNAGFKTVGSIAAASTEELEKHLRILSPYVNQQSHQEKAMQQRSTKRVARLLVNGARKLLYTERERSFHSSSAPSASRKIPSLVVTSPKKRRKLSPSKQNESPQRSPITKNVDVMETGTELRHSPSAKVPTPIRNDSPLSSVVLSNIPTMLTQNKPKLALQAADECEFALPIKQNRLPTLASSTTKADSIGTVIRIADLRFDIISLDEDSIAALLPAVLVQKQVALAFVASTKEAEVPDIADEMDLENDIETIAEEEPKTKAKKRKAKDKKKPRRRKKALHNTLPLLQPNIEGLAICWNSTHAYYVQIGSAQSWEFLRAIARCSTMVKIAYKMLDKFALLLRYGVKLRGELYDPLIAAWMIEPEEGINATTIELVASMFAPSVKIAGNPETALARACKEAMQSLKLSDVLVKRLMKDRLFNSYRQVEMKLIPILAEMQHWGMGFQRSVCKEHVDLLDQNLNILEQKAHKAAGREFMITSPLEVSIVLFDELKLPCSKALPPSKTNKLKTHRKSTNAEVLKEIVHLHPLPDLIIQHRKLQALKTKYINCLPRYGILDEHLGMERIHATQMQTSTPTGRLSVKNPNLQCIPHEYSFTSIAEDAEATELSGEAKESPITRSSTGLLKKEITISLRNAFVAQKGCTLLAADYSQLEVRLMAHFSQDAKLLSILKRGGDVFKNVASSWLDLPPSLISKEQRDQAKSICYGLLYGIGATSLAKQLDMTKANAAQLQESFKKTYKGVTRYLDKVVRDCKTKGYVETICGRRRYLPAINSNSREQRTKAERQAVNTISQGSAADLVKIAMVKIQKKLAQLPNTVPAHLNRLHTFSKPIATEVAKDANIDSMSKCRLILQIHDELLYEVPNDMIKQTVDIVRKEMESCLSLTVPITVKVQVGTTWGKMEIVPAD